MPSLLSLVPLKPILYILNSRIKSSPYSVVCSWPIIFTKPPCLKSITLVPPKFLEPFGTGFPCSSTSTGTPLIIIWEWTPLPFLLILNACIAPLIALEFNSLIFADALPNFKTVFSGILNSSIISALILLRNEPTSSLVSAISIIASAKVSSGVLLVPLIASSISLYLLGISLSLLEYEGASVIITGSMPSWKSKATLKDTGWASLFHLGIIEGGKLSTYSFNSSSVCSKVLGLYVLLRHSL